MTDKERDELEDESESGEPEVPEAEQDILEETEELEGATEQEEPPTSIVLPQPSRPPIILPAPAPALGKVGETLWGKPQPAPPKNELSDLFEVPEADDNDMYVDDLFELDEDEDEEEDDLSDLTRVTNEDIMGTPPKPRPLQRFRRTGRVYNPPTSMGGTR